VVGQNPSIRDIDDERSPADGSFLTYECHELPVCKPPIFSRSAPVTRQELPVRFGGKSSRSAPAPFADVTGEG
jgi:hypothetical protein